jgi:hypothetical protein
MAIWTARLPFSFTLFPRCTAARVVERTPSPSHPGGPSPSDAPDRDPALQARRAEALRRLFPKLYSWCANRRDLAYAVDVHAYLAQATNVTELEQRIRAIEQRRHFGFG